MLWLFWWILKHLLCPHITHWRVSINNTMMSFLPSREYFLLYFCVNCRYFTFHFYVSDWLARLLTDWLGRSANQERFYDTHYRTKSTCGPQTIISPPGRLGQPVSLSLLACLQCLSGVLISAIMKIRLDWLWIYAPHPAWTYPVITHGRLSLLSPTLTPTQTMCWIWKDLQPVSAWRKCTMCKKWNFKKVSKYIVWTCAVLQRYPCFKCLGLK